MKKFLDFAFSLMASALFLFGIVLIIGSVNGSDNEFAIRFSLGLGCIAYSVFIFGFSYIVEAAITYLEKNRKAEE